MIISSDTFGGFLMSLLFSISCVPQMMLLGLPYKEDIFSQMRFWMQVGFFGAHFQLVVGFPIMDIACCFIPSPEMRRKILDYYYGLCFYLYPISGVFNFLGFTIATVTRSDYGYRLFPEVSAVLGLMSFTVTALYKSGHKVTVRTEEEAGFYD